MKELINKGILFIINLIGVILLSDIANIYNLYKFKDGAGIGIHVLLGLIEINDKVAYNKVPYYLITLFIVVVMIIIFDIYVIHKIRHKQK